jgi:hypothetical protein
MEGVLTMRSASALRFSKGCSSLNLDRMVTDLETRFLVLRFCLEEEGVQRVVVVFYEGCFVMEVRVALPKRRRGKR